MGQGAQSLADFGAGPRRTRHGPVAEAARLHLRRIRGADTGPALYADPAGPQIPLSGVRAPAVSGGGFRRSSGCCKAKNRLGRLKRRSEEHTSELQSLMRISYSV